MNDRYTELQFTNGLSYDDVLLRPRRSDVRSRSDPDINSVLVGDIEVETPIISAPMDSVTESQMAQTLADNGGVGIIHRFLDVEEQASNVEQVDGQVGASVGIDNEWLERAHTVVDAGADFVCIDVAHAHSDMCLESVQTLQSELDVPIMAGNVSTREGAVDLVRAGADGVKVGIGPGSHCLTREVAGVGVPQVTAIKEVTEGLKKARVRGDIDDTYIPVVADGGIQSSGDISKALTLGADTVMIGGLFGGCEESPAPVVEVEVRGSSNTSESKKYKKTRGMASEDARDDHDLSDNKVAEGGSGLTPYKGSATNVIKKLSSGLQTSFSYLGAHNIEEARKRSQFIRVSNSVQNRNGTHGVFTDEGQN
jgi:IMP dehydrogenase